MLASVNEATGRDLSHRSLVSAASRIGANLTATVLALARAVALARLLPVEAFGVYALAGSLVAWTACLGTLGMTAALLHRAPHTRDEERAAAVHFTLVGVFSLLWAGVMTAAALAAATGTLRLALLVLIWNTVAANLAETPRALLIRRVEHRRLAVVQVLATAASVAVAVPLAVTGGGVMALLAVDLVNSVVALAALYLWRPVWRPRLAWPVEQVRHFVRFGARSALADLVVMSVVKLDKVWTGVVLGSTALGFYSRAFVFANYVQRTLFAPLNLVMGGSYAELAADRSRLSQAWLVANAMLLRASCALAGVLGLAAPELIAVVLGERWLPMQTAFRILLACTVLEPLRTALGALFVAVGRPGVVVRAGVLQLVVLALGVTVFSRVLGITGVAVALNLAVAVGVGALLVRARAHVDVRLGRLAGAPLLALALALAAGGAAPSLVGWEAVAIVVFAKGVVFAIVFAGVLLALERRWLAELLASARAGLAGNRDAGILPP